MPNKYSTVVLYTGEIYPTTEPDCWEFESLKEAAQWLVDQDFAKNIGAAKTGLSSVLSGRLKHYKGITISVAYTHEADQRLAEESARLKPPTKKPQKPDQEAIPLMMKGGYDILTYDKCHVAIIRVIDHATEDTANGSYDDFRQVLAGSLTEFIGSNFGLYASSHEPYIPHKGSIRLIATLPERARRDVLNFVIDRLERDNELTLDNINRAMSGRECDLF